MSVHNSLAVCLADDIKFRDAVLNSCGDTNSL